MSGTASETLTLRESEAVNRGWLVLLAVLWLPFLWRLTAEWSASVEQAYGWAVPLMAAFFANERARRMPRMVALSKGGRVLAGVVLGGALVLLPAAQTILSINTSWPTAQWATFALVAAATLSAVAWSAGLRVAAHFVFPVLFVGTALTWPAVWSTRIGLGLGSWNAQLAAQVVSAIGYPAVVNGNVIEVASGWVGVDEACSGLRSMQAAVMAGLFFGELFLLSRVRRMALVLGAVGVAVGANAIRTTTLTWLAASDSIAASAAWHDRAGAIEMVATLAGIAVLARGFAGAVPTRASGSAVSLPVPRALRWTILLGGVFAAAAPALWFGSWAGQRNESGVEWELVRADPTWQPVEIAEGAKKLLQPDLAEGWMRPESAGSARAYALLVSWSGADGRGLSGQAHDPTICLPASGRSLELLSGRYRIDVEGVPVEFTRMKFVAEGRRHHVFYAHWDAVEGRSRDFGSMSVLDIPRWRLERVKERRGANGAAFLAFVVPEADEDAAQAWVAEWVPLLLRRR